ncbi:winged helix-turn-helix domain-containing protein [Alphaproteobacteria bacterium]|jgi:DNA-binding response OmpR family regulator|nr:winged helix-turn-helix domain-containing protein [Alphaproteobacteria bacterium]
MEEKINILIYEKEIKLNQILKEQVSKLKSYQIYKVTDEKKLIELFESQIINVLILNLNQLNENLKTIILDHRLNNTIKNLLCYYNKSNFYLNIKETEITVLEKPFKIKTLVNKLERLLDPKTYENSNVLLMNHIRFLPYEKVLINLKTKNKERLTEKENKLLLYLYNNKNIEITKNKLLNSIWGLSEGLNTHTLETHIYRLKQKINKLDPNLSFLLSNQNGLYLMELKVEESS